MKERTNLCHVVTKIILHLYRNGLSVRRLIRINPVGDSVVEDCSLNLSELNQDPDQRLEEPKAVSDSA